MLDFQWDPKLAREVEIEEMCDEARDEGRREEKLNNIRTLLKNTNFSTEQVMNMLGIAPAQQKELLAML